MGRIWPRVPLGEVVDRGSGLIQTGPFGSQLHMSDYTNLQTGIPLIMPKDMVGGRINYGTTALVEPSKAKSMARHSCRTSDVVLARRGDIGRCVFVRPEDAGVLCGTGSLRIAVQGSELDPHFLYYFVSSDAGRAELEGRTVGATMANLSEAAVRAVEVPLPPLAAQRKVSALLAAYDDLIENNNRRIKILEEVAQRIYREWFVDFRFPGHENVPLADSELGLIPSGWSVVSLEEVAEASRGLSWDRAQETDASGIPVITIPNVQNRLQLRGLTYLTGVSDRDVDRYSLREGDVVLVGSNGNPDRVGHSVRVAKGTDVLFASF